MNLIVDYSVYKQHLDCSDIMLSVVIAFKMDILNFGYF